MTAPADATFRDAIRRLHCTKDASYRDAWKKRGEVISILANIARKVDRLETLSAGAPVTPDESVLDTAVDLLVYSIKYQTYLADQDADVAARLFDGTCTPAPYSDGSGGFDLLLARLDLTPLDQANRSGPAQATRSVVTAFADLEACFHGEPAPIGRRAERAMLLTGAAVTLLRALRRDAPERYRDFLATYLKGSG